MELLADAPRVSSNDGAMDTRGVDPFLGIDDSSVWRDVGPDGWDEIWRGYWREIPAMASAAQKTGSRPAWAIMLPRQLCRGSTALS